MPIYHRVGSNKPILYFWGDTCSWDNLIVKNCKAAENVYVCDQIIPEKYYPKEIKVVRSVSTMSRFLRGVNLQKSIVFINMTSFEKARKFVELGLFHTFQYLIMSINTKELIYLLKHEALEPSSRRSIKHLRKYK